MSVSKACFFWVLYIFFTHNGDSRYRLRKKFRKLVLYVLLQITDLKLQFQNVCFSVTGVPMELKAILFPTALRYFSSNRLLFQAQYSCLDGGIDGDINGEWWPQISGLSTRCLPWGKQLINFSVKYWVYGSTRLEDKVELNTRLDFIFCFATVLCCQNR